MSELPPFPIPLPTLEGSRTLVRGYITVEKDTLRHSDGRLFEYEKALLSPFAVMVIAETAAGLLVLNREYRHPTGKVLIGCPGGLVDAGEPIVHAAQRELLEETGYEADDFKILGEVYPFPGITGQKVYFLSARNARKARPLALDPSEIVQPFEIAIDALLKSIEEKADVDGLLCTALFFYQNRHGRS